MKRLCLLIWLCLATFAPASMFELPEGEWRSSERDWLLEIGAPAEKTLMLRYFKPTRDLRSTTWTGVYKVTANKGDPHFEWTINEITSRGRDGQLMMLPFAKGDTVRGILQYGENGAVTLTLFDQDIQPIFTCELKP